MSNREIAQILNLTESNVGSILCRTIGKLRKVLWSGKMNKKQQKDKQLLENIDKAAAGEKLPEESGLDKDTKAALELSRKWPPGRNRRPKNSKRNSKPRLRTASSNSKNGPFETGRPGIP